MTRYKSAVQKRNAAVLLRKPGRLASQYAYCKLNRQRSVFPSDQALLKALYLSTFEATKKWTMPLRNWGRVYGELQIMYEGRLPE